MIETITLTNKFGNWHYSRIRVIGNVVDSITEPRKNKYNYFYNFYNDHGVILFLFWWSIGWGWGVKKLTKNKNRLVFFCWNWEKKIKLKLQGGVNWKKKLITNLIFFVRGVVLGFTRIQFFQHMFLKKKKQPRVMTYKKIKIYS